MSGKKDSVDKQNEAKKRQFIREQVKKDKKSVILNVLKKIGITILIALFFGAVSGITILLINTLGKVRLPFTESRETAVQTPEAVTGSPSFQENQSAGDPLSENDINTLKDFSRISEKIASIGKECNSFVLEVINTRNKSDWFDNDVDTSTTSTGIVSRYQDGAYYITVTGIKGESFESGSIIVKDHYSDEAKAKTVNFDRKRKIAVLRVDEGDMPEKMKKHISVARISSDSFLTEGMPVIAVGSPNGVIYSVDCGFITKTDTKVQVTDNELDFYSTNINFSDDAAGVVTDISGNVVGVIDNTYSNATGKSGLAFCGTDELSNDIEAVISGKSITYFGIEGVDVDKKTAIKEGLPRGVYVTAVDSDSPALKGGIRVADVITEIDGKEIKNLSDVKNAIMQETPGSRIKVSFTRYSGDSTIKKTNNVTLR